jgi:CubicO group peptidase (beta-lactamase class C family)
MCLIKRFTQRFGGGVGIALAAAASVAVTGQTLAQYDPERLYTVLNPTGFPPPTELKALAPRPESLDGKTIYFVDVTFNDGDKLLMEMQKWFATHMPNVKTEFRVKGGGGYTAEDPALFEEIEAVGGLMVMAIGH